MCKNNLTEIQEYVQQLLDNRDYFIKIQISNRKLGLPQDKKIGKDIFALTCQVNDLLNIIQEKLQK